MTDEELLDKAYEIEGSYRKLVEKVGKSAATWHTLHMGKYKHNPAKLYALIRENYGYLESEMIEFPAIGAMHPTVCRKYGDASAEGKNISDRIYLIVKKHCATCERGRR